MDINSIKDPKFLKNLSENQLTELCGDIRNEIIRATKNNGGHLSSNLGVVELTVALHKHYDFEKDKLFFDVGHQCYTHKILTGRKLDTLRQKDGISGFPKLNESIYDHFEGGHSSNSLSNALGYAVSRDLKGENYNIVCLIGDASISNGLAFEALNDNRIRNHKMIIILNDNGMSISKNVGNVSKLFSMISTSGLYNRSKSAYKRMTSKTKFGRKFYSFMYSIKNGLKRALVRGNFFVDLGFNYIGVVDGHNINKIEKALKRADKSLKSTIIHVKTIKGLGYKNAEQDLKGVYHGVAPEKLENTASNHTWSELYSTLFTDLAKKDEKIVLISPATLVGSKFDDINKEIPNRVFDVGIAEEHAISYAAGISLNGYKPYVSIYSTFLQRAFDQVSHDIARMNLGTTLLIDRCGLSDGDGDTHQGIFDESVLMTIPNTCIAMASNESEAARLIELSSTNNDLMCIRYPKGIINSDETIKNDVFNKYDWLKVVNNNNKKVIVTFGPVINEIYKSLKNSNFSYDLVNAIFQKPLNLGVINDLINNYDEIIIFNQYGTENGFNFALINELILRNYKGKIISKALKNEFGSHQTVEEALKEQKMDVASFIKGLSNE